MDARKTARKGKSVISLGRWDAKGEVEALEGKMIESEKDQCANGQQHVEKMLQSSGVSVQIKENRTCDNREDAGHENKFPTDGIDPEESSSDQNKQNLQREESFVKMVKKEATKLEQTVNTSSLGQLSSKKMQRKKIKKSIFISYSPDAGFVERKFIVETVRQLKENNLSEDIWFDKDEKNTDSPCWFSFRMEAVERCRAAILFLSDCYFTCPVTMYESRALMGRKDTNTVHIFPVLFSLEDTEMPKHFQNLGPGVVNLTGLQIQRKSIAERSSIVVGSLMMDLERLASIGSPPPQITSPDGEFTGEYKKKKISQWTANDLQEWLFKLGIKEFYRQSLAENMIDGFLLMSMTDQDMVSQIGIDSRAVRKKIMQQVLQTLDKEHKLPDNWHLRARTQRPRPNCLYLVYDPTDVRLAQNLKLDLTGKGLQVRNRI